jgi:hypothetical protein
MSWKRPAKVGLFSILGYPAFKAGKRSNIAVCSSFLQGEKRFF